jgi:hypothetical protein
MGPTGRTPRRYLVAGVGAASDQADAEVKWPSVLLGDGSEFGEWVSKIGSEGSVDVGLKRVQVDLDDLVVLGTLTMCFEETACEQ